MNHELVERQVESLQRDLDQLSAGVGVVLQYSQQYGYRIRLWVDGKRELAKDEYTSWHNSAIKAWDHGANPILTRWGLLWRPWRAMGG